MASTYMDEAITIENYEYFCVTINKTFIFMLLYLASHWLNFSAGYPFIIENEYTETTFLALIFKQKTFNKRNLNPEPPTL